MIDTLTYYVDTNAPAIVRRLSAQGGGTLDIQPGQTFSLRVRPRDASNVVVDGVMTADADADTLTYQPAAGDFTDEGVYHAWVVADLGSGVTQESDEFTINVFAHAPGQGTRIDIVARASRAMAPVAWDTVRGIRDVGDVEMQRLVDLAKLRVLRVTTPVPNEASLDPRVVDYIAKKVLVDHVLEMAIDFWRNEVVARTARGNAEEVESYPDRIRATENQLKRFKEDLEGQQVELEEVLGAPTGPIAAAPALDCVAPLITPGLETFPRPFATSAPCDDWELP